LESNRVPSAERRLSAAAKLVYSLGDHTVNVVLSATAFFYLIFLTDEAGLRPALAGLVVWIARAFDAVTDPLMGRLSDLTRWRGGRRRPYFLIGAAPLGLFFALMWGGCPFEAQLGRFFYYSLVYMLLSLALTILSVPYLALIPEMATRYDERTSVNTWRGAAAVLGTLVAAGMKPLSDAFGGGSQGWAWAGGVLAVWLVVPWPWVHRVSFERPEFSREVRVGFSEGLRLLVSHPAYRSLSGLYVLSRISYDLISAMFLLYFKVYLLREGDFFPTLALFLGVAVLSLPVWLRISRHFDKRSVFLVGAWWWLAAQLLIFAVGPDWPRWLIFAFAAIAAVGFAIIDLMPWSMIGEVVDEDELRTGERREGVYLGAFTFLRKLGGAGSVLLAGVVLDLCGYAGERAPAEQPELAVGAIRALASLGPALFLALAIAAARGYRLTRARHAEIVAQLEQRRG
jgi:GPH family glycoside/pentoside/hexuronide:cation symporter